jgi:hypothetical protein
LQSGREMQVHQACRRRAIPIFNGPHDLAVLDQ